MSKQNNHYWIWTRVSSADPETGVCFKTSGIDRNEVHWSGEEIFGPSSADFPSWKWIFENRFILPPLIERNRVIAGLETIGSLLAPPDGIYFLGDAILVAEWTEHFKVAVTTLGPNDVSPMLRLMSEVSGGNCFVFMRGRCEASLAIGDEQSDTHVSSRQAKEFIQTIFDDTPPHHLPPIEP
jgi:hypothetical protein